ncbi:MAG: hypothetical protein KDC07_08745, partial [Chitinophagaceae bacterium]|nr:hypothetical protein [Chitinophagaceae bacterium]
MKISAYTTLFILMLVFFTNMPVTDCIAGEGNTSTTKVVSATTQTGLPYAVVTSHSGKGIYTDEQGVFDATVFPAGDSLTFYCVGYERVTRSAGQLPGTIALQPLSRTMNEVVISANTPVKTIPYPKRGMPSTWSSSVGMELATRIPFPPEDSGKLKKLTEVRIRIKQLNEENPCRLHIYAATPADTPGEELLTKDILLTKKD